MAETSARKRAIWATIKIEEEEIAIGGVICSCYVNIPVYVSVQFSIAINCTSLISDSSYPFGLLVLERVRCDFHGNEGFDWLWHCSLVGHK
jgi:hypothetical protein